MGKINFKEIFKNEENRKVFFIHVVLKFKLNPKSILELFDTVDLINADNEDDIVKYFYEYYDLCKNVVMFNFAELNIDQEIAINNFKNYYNKLMIVCMSKNKIELLKEFIEDVTDSKYYNLLRNGLKEEDDYKILFDYQLKYGVSIRSMAKQFDLSYSTYDSRLKKYASETEINYEILSQLIDYNKRNNMYHNGR